MFLLHLLAACSTDAAPVDTGDPRRPGDGNGPDKVAPTVAWVAPAPLAELAGTTQLSVSAADDRGVASVELKVDEVVIASLTQEPWVADFDTTTLPNGEHDFSVVVKDAAGNRASASVRAVFENGAPASETLQFMSPTGESALCGDVPIEVYADAPATSVTLYIDGDAKTADAEAPYYWTWDSTGRADGEHVLAAVALLADGTQVTDRITVSLANDDSRCAPLPSVRITEPDPGELLGSEQEVVVESAVGDLELIRLEIDGTALTSWAGPPYTYTWDTDGLAEGAHVLAATAVDTHGQKTRTQNLVYVDSSAPYARILTPAYDELVHGDVLVTAAASDASGVAQVRLFVEGDLEGRLTAEPWEWTWDTSTFEGPVELEIEVVDAVGRVSTDSVTVIVDNPPDVHWLDPTDGAVLSGVETLAATASDDVGLAGLRWLADGVEFATGSSSPFRTSLDTCSMVSGPHTLEVEAEDSRGQATSAAIAVTVEQGQEVTHHWPSGTLDPYQIVRSWVVDEVATTEVAWLVDGVEVASSTSGTADPDCPVDCVDLCLAFESTLDATGLTDGAHILTIRATNALGDVRSLDVDIEVDRDADGDGVDAISWGGEDCDDGDPSVSPLASERCDGTDQDCDSLADEDFDQDGDGYYSARLCTSGDDCDDADATVSPAAVEVCDGVDNDCDDTVDSSGPPTSDDGTVATGTLTASASNQLWGNVYVADADVTLTSFEAQITPGSGAVWYAVYEADSPTGEYSLLASRSVTHSGSSGWYSSGALDAPLTAGRAYLLAVSSSSTLQSRYLRGASLGSTAELTAQGWLKHTAAGEPTTVGDDPSASALFGQAVHVEWVEEVDLDADGDGETPFCGDCDDAAADRASSFAESCDGVDNDCDGTVPADEVDADGDGDRVCDADCDDADPDRAPSAWESCDGVDNDCDGVVGDDELDEDGDGVAACVDESGVADCDDTDASTLVATFYLDSDGDGRGLDAVSSTACPPPAGYTRLGGDCDDDDDTRSPDAVETCDSVDNDCDGVVDEGYDADGDGVGACDDCDDGDASVSPAATEVCGDTVDEDCDGVAAGCRYAGSDSLTIANHYVIGETSASYAGSALAGGDIDGDGVVELMVGAPESNAGPSNGGAVYVVQGPLVGDVDLGAGAVVRLLGESSSDYLGYAVAMADLDGDGLADVVAGAHGDDDGGSAAGAAYVISGVGLSSGSVALGAAKLTGATASDTFGRRLVSPGDVDGDGVSDLLVGAAGLDAGGTSAGGAYLFLGPITGSEPASAADARFVGEDATDYAGYGLGLGGDFDGDGLADLCIGAHGDDTGGSAAGAVYLLFGAPTSMDLSFADVKVTGGAASDSLGYGLSVGADVDGDGWDDLVVAAEDSDLGGAAAGAAFVFFGPLASDRAAGSADATLVGVAAGDRAGASLAAAGDLDGDGAEELLVGAYLADDAGVDAGTAYLVYGPVLGTLGLGSADATFYGESAGDYAGAAAEAPGDVDGDGLGDLLIGASRSDLAVSNGGAVYVLSGGG